MSTQYFLYTAFEYFSTQSVGPQQLGYQSALALRPSPGPCAASILQLMYPKQNVQRLEARRDVVRAVILHGAGEIRLVVGLSESNPRHPSQSTIGWTRLRANQDPAHVPAEHG
jgi:hypothetical protein